MTRVAGQAASRIAYCYRRATAAGGRIADSVVERALDYACLRALGLLVRVVIFTARWGTVATGATWAYRNGHSTLKQEVALLAAPAGLNKTA